VKDLVAAEPDPNVTAAERPLGRSVLL